MPAPDDTPIAPDSGPAPSPAAAPRAGTAPVAEPVSPGPPKPPAATSRVLWVTTYLVVVGLTVLRAPLVYDYLGERVPADLSAGIGDPDMEALALRTGVFLGIALTALVMAIYFSLAAVMEKKIFTASKTLYGNVRFGLFYLIIVACTLPIHMTAVLFRIANPRGSILYYVYSTCVAILAPLLFRSVWRGLPGKKIAILYTASIVLALMTVIG